MHGPLTCGHVLVPKQISKWAVPSNDYFLTSRTDGAHQPGRVGKLRLQASAVRRLLISDASSCLRWNAGSVSGWASSRLQEQGMVIAANQASPDQDQIRPGTSLELPLGMWEPWIAEGEKWWRHCQYEETTSVVCRDMGIRVPLNPIRSASLWARTANSSSSVHKCQVLEELAYCW